MVDLKNFFARALEPEQPMPGKRSTLHSKPKEVAVQADLQGIEQLGQANQIGDMPEPPARIVEQPALQTPSEISPSQTKESAMSEMIEMTETSEMTEYEKYEQLLNEQAALNAKVEAARRDAVAAEISAIKSKIDRLRITPQDLGFRTVAAASDSPRSGRGGAPRGGVVTPKYRDPSTGKTWSGRGRAPRWLQGTPKTDWERYLIQSDWVSQADSPSSDS